VQRASNNRDSPLDQVHSKHVTQRAITMAIVQGAVNIWHNSKSCPHL